MAFKIKRKPSKPKQRKNKVSKEFESYTNLSELVEWADQQGVPYDEVRVKLFDYYGSTNLELTATVDEPDHVYQQRLEDYEKKLAQYEKWREDHQQEIQDELARQAQSRRRHRQDEIDNLEQHLAELKAKQKQ